MGDRQSGDQSRGPGGFRSGSSSDEATVLIVERSASTREAMREVLRTEYRIQMAATYDEALRRVEADAYEGIVVSLYDQGKEKSTELLEQFRTRVSNTEGALVAIWGPSPAAGPEALLEEGADAVLQMPFAQTDLLDVLDRNV